MTPDEHAALLRELLEQHQTMLEDNRKAISEGREAVTGTTATARRATKCGEGRLHARRTLRDARKFGWYPGVTSIIKCAAAPGLETWKQNQVLMAALTLPRVEGETSDSFAPASSRIRRNRPARRATWERSFTPPSKGTTKASRPTEDFWPHVKGSRKPSPRTSASRSGSRSGPVRTLGYGTKADLSCNGTGAGLQGQRLRRGESADLKTWDEHAMQLAATRNA
jgi:hypothetical protein